MKHRFFALALMAYGLAMVGALAEETIANFGDEPIQPIERPASLDPAKVALGEQLFNDTRLSANNLMSCATCHTAEHGGTVNRIDAPPGFSGKSVPLNVPTFLGSSLNFKQFWDGRADTLQTQMDGPVTGHDEMGTTWADIAKKLKAIPKYTESFLKIYSAAPGEQNIKDAIATFEQSKVPTDSPFDQYLRGDQNAISTEAQQGYALFKNLGCASCHQGQNVGGNMFQKFGIIEDYFKDRGNIIDKDYGRYNVTHLEEDRYVFKVPALRNVELTAPYFHDGSAPTLDKAVDVMAKYQLGRVLSETERVQLVAFLKTLTGKLPPDAKR